MQYLSGLEYLKAEISCLHDKTMEKSTWNERLKHFETIDIYNVKTTKKASNPIGLRAAIKAYDEVQKDEPTGYMISLDACSSGKCLPL